MPSKLKYSIEFKQRAIYSAKLAFENKIAAMKIRKNLPPLLR